MPEKTNYTSENLKTKTTCLLFTIHWNGSIDIAYESNYNTCICLIYNGSGAMAILTS